MLSEQIIIRAKQENAFLPRTVHVSIGTIIIIIKVAMFVVIGLHIIL